MQPKVSIIVTVYNTEKYLARCIDSILNQTLSDFELILVDDYSTDSSQNIINDYAKNDSRIVFLYNQKNMGSSLSRKIGFEKSNGLYIQFIDSDDYIEPDMIEKLYQKAVSDNYDMVYCDCYRYNKFSNASYEKMPQFTNDYIANMRISVFSVNLGAVVWNKIVKRSIYEKVIFPKDSYNEDNYITTQSLYFSKKIGYINSALYHYQYNNSSLINRPKMQWKKYKEASNNYKKIIEFLKEKQGTNLSEFEPELSIKIKRVKKMHPLSPKRLFKTIFFFLIPFEPLRNQIIKFYKNHLKRAIN